MQFLSISKQATIGVPEMKKIKGEIVIKRKISDIT